MSNFSEAFAGFKMRSPQQPPRKVISLPVTEEEEAEENPTLRRHYSLIADHVLPFTIRLQKEMRGRKYMVRLCVCV
jgi:hypothetical protein